MELEEWVLAPASATHRGWQRVVQGVKEPPQLSQLLRLLRRGLGWLLRGALRPFGTHGKQPCLECVAGAGQVQGRCTARCTADARQELISSHLISEMSSHLI